MSLKILHILDHSLPYLSGYSYRTDYILRHQQKLDIVPVAVTSPKHESMNGRIEVVNGITYYRCGKPNGTVGGFVQRYPFLRESQQVRQVRDQIAEIITREKPDVLHAHSPSLNGIPALLAARKANIPVVYELRAFWEDAAVDHGTFPQGSFKYRLSRRIETWLLKRVAAVTTLGGAMKQEIVSRGIPAARVYICPNGVDTEKFRPAAKDGRLLDSLGLKGKVILGFIGSFYHYEGLDLILQAMGEVVAKVPQARLVLVGDGRERENLEALVESLGISQYVVFTGRVPHDEVRSYYALMDLLVYPRRRMRLTDLVTPLKPLEAMAMERAVLASDVGGIRELVKEGDTGFLFPAEDVTELTHLCVRLAQDPTARELVARRGRAFVLRERNWPGIVRTHRMIYDRLLSG